MADQVAAWVLKKLLDLSEKAWGRGGDLKTTLPMTPGRCGPYHALQTRQAVDQVHAALGLVAKDGEVSLQWDRRAGEGGRLTHVDLVDPDAVAARLGVTPAWTHYTAAELALSSHVALPVVRELLGQWRRGSSPRGKSVASYRVFADALRLVDYCRQHGSGGDLAVRRVSGILFRDTKHIETSLGVALDVVTGGAVDGPPRDDDEVLSNLGLVRFPQPLLIAGSGMIRLSGGGSLQLVRPYLGLHADSIAGLEARPAYILSVENLTTFNELARGAGGAIEGLVIYTGGMPSTSMRKGYRALLADRADVPLYHWGDTDLGGLRIAAVLHREAAACGASLRLWQMGCLPEHMRTAAGEELKRSEVAKMMEIAAAHGWSDLFDGFEDTGVAIEQETQVIPSLASLAVSTR